MRKNKNIIKFSIFLFLLFSGLVNANPTENYKICISSADEVGCILNIAQKKAFKIYDNNIQAKAIADLLKENTDLNRSDYDLMTRSIQLLKHKNLNLESKLDLQIALATYFSKRDENQSNLHTEKAIEIFYNAISKNEPKDRPILFSWACGLIDGNFNIWKVVSHITAEYCNIEYAKAINNYVEFDFLNNFMAMIASWVQSDFIELGNNKEILSKKLSDIENSAIKNNKKRIRIEIQKIKILNYTIQSDMFRRSGLNKQAMQNLNDAKDALAELERLTNDVESIESRVIVANVLNAMYEYEEAINLLKPIKNIFDDKKKIKKIQLNIQIDYLIALAEALDKGGFSTYNEIKLSRNEYHNRQSDVLFEKYLKIEKYDNKNGKKSEESFKALKEAAEAGNFFAMHNLGLEYAIGSNLISKDLDKAAYWYSWSATLGFAGAQNNLGDLYEDISVKDSDLGLSIYWYTQAAMQGEPTAYLSLGDLFFKGKGVPKNYVTASIWLSLAKKYLPEGINKKKASDLLEIALLTLDEKTQKYVKNRVFNFVPLKQTENKLSDKPTTSED